MNLPTTVPEAEGIATIVHWIDLIRDFLTSDAGHRVLQKQLREQIAKGTLPRMEAIAAAESGQRDFDAALREIAAGYLSRREEMPTELANYVQRVLVQPLIAPAPGRSFGDDYMRDTAIRVLVQMATERFGVPFSRNRASQRSSACYLVSVALGRRGYNLGERRIEKIVPQRSELASRLAAFDSGGLKPSASKGGYLKRTTPG